MEIQVIRAYNECKETKKQRNKETKHIKFILMQSTQLSRAKIR